MQYKKLFKNLLSSLVLIGFLWLIFFISTLFNVKQENSNDKFIPESATFAFRIDGRELTEDVLYSIFIDSKDEKVVQKIKDLISESRDKSYNDIGVNFVSDIIVFSNPYKNGAILGISLNLNNSDKFRSNIQSLLSKNQSFEIIDDVGIILTYTPDKKNEPITDHEFQQFFTSNILPLREKSVSPFIEKVDSKKFLEAYTKGYVFGSSTCFSSSDIQFEMLKKSIELNGDLTIAQKQLEAISVPEKLLKAQKGDFHFSTSIIPKSVQDSLNNYCAKAEINLPPVKTISLNYRGLNIINDETGMHTLPEIDLLIEFKQPISASVSLNDKHLLTYLDAVFLGNQLIVNDKKYFIQQIGENSIYLGTNKNPSFSNNSNKEILSIQGNLSSILKVDGGGMIVSFLEIVPAYRASKELFNNTEGFNITLKKESKEHVKLTGEIYFKKEHFAMNEVLKLVLEARESF